MPTLRRATGCHAVAQLATARHRAAMSRAALAWAAPLVGLAALLPPTPTASATASSGMIRSSSRASCRLPHLGDVLAPPRDIPQFSPDYYRPLTIATYLLDRAVGGDAPFVVPPFRRPRSRATSVLVYLLALQLLGSSMAATRPLTAAARRPSALPARSPPARSSRCIRSTPSRSPGPPAAPTCSPPVSARALVAARPRRRVVGRIGGSPVSARRRRSAPRRPASRSIRSCSCAMSSTGGRLWPPSGTDAGD